MTRPTAPDTVALPIAALVRMGPCVAAFIASLFPFLVLFSSCATVFNRATQPIHIAADPHIRKVSVGAAISVDSSSISVDSSLMGGAAPKTYWVQRNNQPLPIRLQLDSTERTVFFQPRNSFAWWANIYCNYGLGMLIDRGNTRRYSHPVWNYFEIDDKIIHYSRFAPIPKGSMRLSLEWPFFNDFSIRPPKGQYHAIGIFGLEASWEYFYKKDRYISLSAGVATSTAPVDRFGKGYIQTADEFYSSIRANRIVGSFDLGYGISLSQPAWVQHTLGDTVNLDRSFKNTALGLSLSAQYRIGNYFRMGVLYQPTVLGLNLSPALHYQHYISANFIWKLPLNRKMND